MIAVGQLTCTNNLVRNGKAAAKLVQQAAAGNAKVLFLPEAADYIGSNADETVSLAQDVDSSPFLGELRAAIRSLDSPLYVSVGVHEPAGGSKVKNTLLWLDPKGEIKQRYQKIHLFDVDVPNGPILRESNSVERGTEMPQPFDTPVGKLGPCICYDIRFPEQALELRKRGAEILCFPSAFTVKTGQAHWHALNRARAIDTQCYVVSAAQAGNHNQEKTRVSYGHSIVIDPWGEIVAETTDDTEQVIFANLAMDPLQTIRENMPLWQQRDNLSLMNC